jgi:hypothetical protein
MIGRDLGQLGHQGHDVGLRYGLAEADRNRHVRVCDGARSLRDEQMAFRLPHGLKDPLRQALLSQGTGVGPGVGPDGFDHGGAFADTLVLCGRFPRGGGHGKHEQQQGLHDRAVSDRSTIRVDRLRATSGFDRPAAKRNTASSE